MVHLYTAWLPPPVAEATAREKDSFAAAVRSVAELWNPDDEESVYATLKWISIFDTFLNAKSDVSLEDINTLVLLGLELFQKSQNKLYAQVRWGSILIRLIRKYGKKLSLVVHWRPLYDSLINTHFKRNAGPEGWRLRQQHFETLTCLVQSCRRFFPPGSASEIWKEFRSLLENPWHNSSFEGSGFVQLFLPMNKDNEDFFTKDWVRQCIALWESIPNCQFWDIQWVSVLSGCIKSYKSFDWECFLPVLFTKYLNMFEVPVGSGNGSFTFPLEVPRITRFLFSGRTGTSAKAISKSIVYLLKPGGSAQKHFEKLTNLLEQFYHPSNGGRWTSSLERFLRHLVIAFQKRLQQEQLDSSESEVTELHLGKLERASFVRVILKLIDRGQYSKNEGLAETVAIAMSILSYIEPSIMLPFIASRFHLALENDTATHQLKTVITSVAFASRPFLFASIFPSSSGETCDVEVSVNLLVASLSNALLGMDANDPPKTLAAMQLITSIFSNLPEISDDSQLVTLHNISFSEWLERYLLNERSDDSILLILVIRIIDALGNVGSLENEEWPNHMQAWKSESVAIIEPSCNFILSLHTKGKKSVASSVLLKILKRWPSLITQCILNLMSKLLDSSTPEHVVLGSCAILASQTVLRHLVMDSKAFSSFNVGLLASSHHESLKSQKAMTELFHKYNIHFSGLPRSFLRTISSNSDNPEFKSLLSEISAMCVDSNNLHWRYHLMANRVLLLLTLTLRNNSSLSPEDLSKTAGHFLRNLRSQLPQSRMLAISALNSLLTGSCHKYTCQKEDQCGDAFKDSPNSSMSQVLNSILQEEGFSSEILDSLSNIHIIADGEGMSNRGNHVTSLQSATDKAITYFYFDFSSSWPRTPNWISFLRGDSFYSSFARLFKRLIQECGSSVILALKDTIEEFAGAKERSKQCVACEAIAGILQSDISGLLEAWESWIMILLQKMIAASTVEAIPDWAACIRYTVTGKGKFGTRTPLSRFKVLDCLLNPLPETVATSTVAKRYMFLLAAFIEVSPTTLSTEEVKYHNKLLKELLDNMSHSSAQVRETIGSTLSVLCSNLRAFASLKRMNVHWESGTLIETGGDEIWTQQLTGGASVLAANIQNLNHSEHFQLLADITNENNFHDTKLQEGVRRMETLLHFVISSLKSGRSSYLLDIIIGLLYPVVSLQETSHKDLSTLAKAAFELLKWRIFPRPYLEKSLPVLSSLIHDSNWRSRFAALSYVRAFMYRHTFILTTSEKSEIWKCVETLLVDNQIEVREHAAGVLASLMKGGGEELTSIFRDTALTQALSIYNNRKQRISKSSHSQASIHGAVLALAASVLSSPYDMPSWLPDHVTLLARFISEPSPVKATVTKAVAEFRRTHADTWVIQKDSFTEEQLEVLADTSSSSSYFA